MLDWLRERWKHGLTGKTRQRSRAIERQVEQELAYERELQSLPIEAARRQALRLLDATALLQVTRATPVIPPAVAALGPELRDFFKRYRRLETANGGTWVDAAAIEPCEWHAGWIEIGACDGHVHLLARAGSDTVAEVADDVDEHERMLATFPSIHHWILARHYSEELSAADGS